MSAHTSQKDIKRRDFILNSNMWAVIIRISLPLIAYNAFNYIYGVIDTIVVAGIDKSAVSAVVVLDQIRTMLFAFGSGLAAGGTIIVARLIGRKDFVAAKKVANTMVCLAVLVAAVILALVLPLARPLLLAIGVSKNLVNIGVGYFSVQMVNVGVSLLNNVYLGLEKAEGKSFNIFLLNIIIMLIKIGLTLFFVFGMNLGITMVAVATLVPNLLLTVFVIVRLSQKSYAFRFSLKNAQLKWEFLQPILFLSVPIFLGRFVFSLGKVIINGMCDHYGDDAVGALGISNSLGGSVTNMLSSVEESTGAIISQNLGNNNVNRAIKAFVCTLCINMTLALLGFTVLTIFDKQITGFFANGDEEFRRMISDIFFFEKIGVIMLGMNSAVLALLYGFGYTRITMIINLSRLFVFRIPPLYYMINYTSLGHEAIGIAMMVSNCGIGLMSIALAIIYVMRIRKGKFKKLKLGETKMEQLSSQLKPKPNRPVRILQFGEGNFLRAFVDYFVQDMNDKGILDAGVVVVQPVEVGRVQDLEKQDGLYTVCLEGIDKGETVKKTQLIDVLSDFVNPYTQYEKYLSYAQSEHLQIVVSNTTEAGIALVPSDTNFEVCPSSYPSKLLAFLKRRYDYFAGDESKGLAIIPCELIDYNGNELKRVLLELCKIMKLEQGFVDWLNNCNHFTNTLVDRIVTGFPRNEINEIYSELGYEDNSVVKCEIFHLWVLEQNAHIERVFPAHKAQLNIKYVQDIAPYKQQKVKILNGAHTALVPVAYLAGIDTVREAVTDAKVREFLHTLIYEEIVPTIELDKEQVKSFADSVLERFENPFVRHELMSIALNSTTKFVTRLLPTLKDYIRIFGAVPQQLLRAFAALIVFYRGKRGQEDIKLADDAAYLQRWAEVWKKHAEDIPALVNEVVAWTDIWGEDLSKLHADVVQTVIREVQKLV